jgi:hypothetical protein
MTVKTGSHPSDLPSRPNVPVNVLIGLDALKAGYGWSDEELTINFRMI